MRVFPKRRVSVLNYLIIILRYKKYKKKETKKLASSALTLVLRVLTSSLYLFLRVTVPLFQSLLL